MRFRLVLAEDLKPKAKLLEIHKLRKVLHPQLRLLWDLPPLKELTQWLRLPSKDSEYAIFRNVAGQIYAPLINEQMDLYCKLEILLLRTEPPGGVIKAAGDIDNRLKTLFDALRMPTKSEQQQIGKGEPPGTVPMFCLLEDDKLVHHVAVETDRILRPKTDNVMTILINVHVHGQRATMGNLSLLAT